MDPRVKPAGDASVLWRRRGRYAKQYYPSYRTHRARGVCRLADARAAGPNDKEQGMAQMSEKFRQLGSEVYVDAATVKESNRAL